MSAMAPIYALCGSFYALLTMGIVWRSQPYGYRALALTVACLSTSIWAFATFAMPQHALRALPGGADLVRDIAWYGFLLVLFRRSVIGRARLGAAFAIMGAVMVFAVGAAMLADLWGQRSLVATWDISVRLGFAVCNLLLIENLFRNVSGDTRWQIKLYCIAIGALSAYDIVMFSGMVLLHGTSPLLLGGRATAALVVAPLLALAALRNRRWKKVQFSPDAVFHSATLMLSGFYLLGVVAAGEMVRGFGASWGVIAEAGLVFTGLVLLMVFVTSTSARSFLRTVMIEHFLSPRYDYRKEWTRCISTLAAPDGHVPLHMRVIRTVADTVDSPAGALYLRDELGPSFRWAASWNWPGSAPAFAPGSSLLALFRHGTWIVELDDAAGDHGGAWLAVPLTHLGDQIGFVLVARPRARFRLDREVFNLLRIIGYETAGILAERRAIESVLQARELHAYGARFAFVAHDIKNVSNQLALLTANAEQYIHVPEFQQDMLVTLRAAVAKIRRMLGRLRDAEQTAPDPEHAATATMGQDKRRTLLSTADLIPCVRQVIANRQNYRVPLRVEADEDTRRAGQVRMDPDVIETVIAHLLDNAIEASEADHPVVVRCWTDGSNLAIDVIDGGSGMTAEFVRDELFRPFGSSKSGGFGIGAFQARELMQEFGGDLLVFSKPGEGTTMRLLLPVVPTLPVLHASRALAGRSA